MHPRGSADSIKGEAMSLYSEYLAPEKYRDRNRQPVSDRTAITLTLVSVAVLVVALIGGSRLLITIL